MVPLPFNISKSEGHTADDNRNNRTTSHKRSRNNPVPKPVLDRRRLLAALDEADICLKPHHLDAFYQQLHRAHYPSLEDFVTNYYKEVEKSTARVLPVENKSTDDSKARAIPLKNPVSKRKSKSRNKQLPKALLNFLATSGQFCTLTSTVREAKTSADGTTTKLAVELHDGELVESVLMRHVSQEGSRATLCVSSQVGCAMGCSFCATGTMGIKGNLNAGEILEQMVHAGRILALEAMERENETNLDLVRNVVFMGMGEPLNNYDNVVDACRSLLDRRRWNLAHGRVTVSTVGVTQKMKQLTQELPEVNLALSLHAPTQESRSAIVPAAKSYPIQGLIDALDDHMMAHMTDRIAASKRKRAMIEYVMLKGETSTFEAAHQLGKLCKNRHLVVNLIPYNKTNVKDMLECPSEVHMKEFRRIVTSYGAFCSIRRTMGADIASACGQLVVEKGRNSQHQQHVASDIEDGPFPRTQGDGNISKSTPPLLLTRSAAPPKEQSAPRKRNKKEEDVSLDENLDKWIKILSVATTIAASVFAISGIMLLAAKKRR